jgi:hypothetical protein
MSDVTVINDDSTVVITESPSVAVSVDAEVVVIPSGVPGPLGPGLPDIAALKALTVTNIRVYVAGYNFAADGGGGMFSGDTASVATADDGLVIAPNAGAGRWLRIFDGQNINVKWYGVNGDGATESSTKLNAAMAAAIAVKGGMYFPSTISRYLLPSALVVPDNTHGLRIFGDMGSTPVGAGYSGACIATTAASVIDMTGTAIGGTGSISEISIERLQLHASGANGKVIKAWNVDHLLLSRLVVNANNGVAIDMAGTADFLIEQVQAYSGGGACFRASQDGVGSQPIGPGKIDTCSFSITGGSFPLMSITGEPLGVIVQNCGFNWPDSTGASVIDIDGSTSPTQEGSISFIQCHAESTYNTTSTGTTFRIGANHKAGTIIVDGGNYWGHGDGTNYQRDWMQIVAARGVFVRNSIASKLTAANGFSRAMIRLESTFPAAGDSYSFDGLIYDGSGAMYSDAAGILSGTGDKFSNNVDIGGSFRLHTQPAGCAQFDASGVLTSTGAPCGGGSGSLTIGTTPISGGASGRVLYENAGVLNELLTTGTGDVVLHSSPVFAGTITAQQAGFAGNVGITAATPSTLPTEGALTIVGGAGIQGNVNIGGGLVAGGGLRLPAQSAGYAQFDSGGVLFSSAAPTVSLIVGTTPISGGTSGHVLYNSGGILNDLITTGTGSVVMHNAPTFAGAITAQSAGFSGNVGITAITPSTMPSEGALTVAGGAGIQGNVNIGGGLVATGLRLSTQSAGYAQFDSAGVLTSTGGTPSSSLIVGSTPISGGATNRVLFQSGTVLSEIDITGTGNAVMQNSPTFTGTITANQAGFSGNVGITINTPSTSPTTGALTVAGGVGVGGALNVTGDFLARDIRAARDATSGVLYWGSAGTTRYLSGDASALQLGGVPLRVLDATAAISPATGALTVAGGVGIGGKLWLPAVANILNVGGGGQGTNSVLNLRYNSSGYCGIEISSSTAGTAGTILSILDSADAYVATWSYGAGQSSLVWGGRPISIVPPVTITDPTASASATTGALTVAGGLGVAKSINCGEPVKVNGASGNAVLASTLIGTTGYSGLSVNPLAFGAAFASYPHILMGTNIGTPPDSGLTFGVPTGSFHTLDVNGLPSLVVRAGSVTFNTVGTTASAANAFLDGAASNSLLRSTSTIKVKADVKNLSLQEARRIVMSAKPISYRSLCAADDPKAEFIGMVAEWEAENDARLVSRFGEEWGGVMYDRYVAPLLAVVADQERRLAALEQKGAKHGT